MLISQGSGEGHLGGWSDCECEPAWHKYRGSPLTARLAILSLPEGTEESPLGFTSQQDTGAEAGLCYVGKEKGAMLSQGTAFTASPWLTLEQSAPPVRGPSDQMPLLIPLGAC